LHLHTTYDTAVRNVLLKPLSYSLSLNACLVYFCALTSNAKLFTDSVTLHVMVDGGLIYLCASESDFGKRQPYAFLNEVGQ